MHILRSHNPCRNCHYHHSSSNVVKLMTQFRTMPCLCICYMFLLIFRISAGCEHNGEVRAIGYRYEDCEQRCTCFENGSLICTTRCPEIERPNNQECRLETSQDDSCCQIMVCQPPTDGTILDLLL